MFIMGYKTSGGQKRNCDYFECLPVMLAWIDHQHRFSLVRGASKIYVPKGGRKQDYPQIMNRMQSHPHCSAGYCLQRPRRRGESLQIQISCCTCRAKRIVHCQRKMDVHSKKKWSKTSQEQPVCDPAVVNQHEYSACKIHFWRPKSLCQTVAQCAKRSKP